MANYFKYLFVLAFCFLLPTSCQEGSEAGDLLGQWKMTENLYVSFSGSVTRFRSLTEGQVFGNFQHVGDSLFIQCYSEKGEKADTIMIEESFGLKPLNNIRVKIATVDSDQLVLTQGTKTWSFHKY